MSLKRVRQMRKAAVLLRDGGLLQAVRSELKHELSSAPPPTSQSQKFHQIGDSVGGFTVEWDDPRTQDVILRRQHGESRQEIAVSALLAPLRFRREVPLPQHALMKVCVKKPGSDPVLRFDCSVEEEGDGSRCHLTLRSVHYYPSLTSSGAYKYRAPRFSDLDPELQIALEDYIADRGISLELKDFVLQHLRKKEQAQYVNWLQKLESFVTKDA